ncbi:hypothetical protein PT015_08445 [Candidatus Mycobacterium wuenschmannii]|uniref:Uncharacterized protein n=1 Tax=Candidatus Mycobacterium wuenschmannii TaxID=3027808 RepID=A0ABY8W4V0_9MYCO|nr:hypothetical protein [Candidatus Mycobacterium wuenschmannii]WIM89453.1 hypothetical protein PT015_08445 [Candidatus Mycobacterium wuenschmannii]
MNDRPTNRIDRTSPGWPRSDDDRTQRAYQQTGSAIPPTSKMQRRDSGDSTQTSAQAWSQDSGDSGYYRESGDY